MFCEKCGAPNPDGSRFCSACGSPMTAPQAAGGKVANLKDRVSSAAKDLNAKLPEMKDRVSSAAKDLNAKIPDDLKDRVSSATRDLNAKIPDDLKDRVSSAVPKQMNVKKLAIMGVAALAVIFLLFSFLGGKGGSSSGGSVVSGGGSGSGIKKDTIAGRWYQSNSTGDLRTVFYFRNDGAVTIWNESGGFSKEADDSGSSPIAKWSVSGNTMEISYSEDQALRARSYFGTGDVELELSADGSTLTLIPNMGSDYTLQRYP